MPCNSTGGGGGGNPAALNASSPSESITVNPATTQAQTNQEKLQTSLQAVKDAKWEVYNYTSWPPNPKYSETDEHRMVVDGVGRATADHYQDTMTVVARSEDGAYYADTMIKNIYDWKAAQKKAEAWARKKLEGFARAKYGDLVIPEYDSDIDD